MTSKEIRREHRLSTQRVRRERDRRIRLTQRMTIREYYRKFLTVVVSAGPRHILRRRTI